MFTQIKRILFFGFILYIPAWPALSQDRKTWDNYTGDWETPSSWNPAWTVPQTDVYNLDVTINGYITANNSLSFSGSSKLIVDGTLVIKGDLTINNDNQLQVNGGGILIVWGNLTFSSGSDITADGYIVITGDLLKAGSANNGSFKGDDDPVRVFIGGTIFPPEVTDNESDFELLNCTSPSDPYPYSGCSYGNMQDFENDPLYTFFLSTCSTGSAFSNSPVCEGNTINLVSPPGISFSWSGPEGFTSNEQNPDFRAAGAGMTGTYTVTVTAAGGCTFEASTSVTVLPLPVISITNPPPGCAPGTADITAPSVTAGSSPGLGWSYHADAQAETVYATPGEATAGTWYIRGTSVDGCQDIKPVEVTINPLPRVSITSSDGPLCINDQRTITGDPQGGVFFMAGGPGNISGNVLRATGRGVIEVEYHYTGACSNTARQTITVNDYPVANAGDDQELHFIFETHMQASLAPLEYGEWSLVSGSGLVHDINSPSTLVTGLSIGENIFYWKVQNESCESGKEIKIKLHDIIIPSAITPNADGFNDYFRTGCEDCYSELIIFNRWGVEEYKDRNYKGDWDGRDKKGIILPNDTYFYILKFNNGLSRKGFVLIAR
jgi:gliding motility-associated-like protein